MKNLYLIFHGRFPSEKAAALFAAKSCEAFAGQGLNVTLLVPRRFGRIKEDLFTYYNLEKNFTVEFLPTFDLFWVPGMKKVAFVLSLVSFSIACLCLLALKSGREDIIYSNENLPILLASLFRKNSFYEVHDMPRGAFFFYKAIFQRVKGVVVTNNWKKETIVRVFNIPETPLFLEKNAVDIDEFAVSVTKKEAREKLGISQDERMVLYTGHLYGWKGVDTLAYAAELLPPDTTVYFVGGTKEDIRHFRERFGSVRNIAIVGFRNHGEMPLWQKAADVVVVPNTAKEDISKYDTSPMKIFEYMASGAPIVATDIPSIREILNEVNAHIVPPDDPEAMARGIQEVLSDPILSERIAQGGHRDVLTHTWGARAGRIARFMEIKK